MSSTETAAAIAAVHTAILTPMAEDARRAGNPMMPLGADASLASYFVRRRDDTAATFRGAAVRTPAELTARLRALWIAETDPRFARLAEELGALAERLARDAEPGASEGDGEVSGFVYPMF